MPIPIHRRLEYARGYLLLGLVAEAENELDAIDEPQRDSVEVMRVRVDILMESRDWTEVIAAAERVCETDNRDDRAWVAWAFALHELKRTEEAQAVLHRAEPFIGSNCGVLQYNLACYACVLGDLAEAKRRLAAAFQLDRQWLSAALEDPDLESIRDQL